MVDATTQAALEAPVVYWRALIYADIQGDVLRATSGLYDRTITASGDSELDGTYESFAHSLIDIGPVRHNETGSDTVTVTLNGILTNVDPLLQRDEDPIYDRWGGNVLVRTSNLLNVIGDKTRWQGRAARLWFYCVNENEVQIGNIIPYYTGYMNDIVISGSPEQQNITLTIENYLASLAGAPSQTYMIQNVFDSGDLSASATLGAANGMGAGGAGTGGGGGSGSWLYGAETRQV
jgi:uncharacterized membrane protein YgcG